MKKKLFIALVAIFSLVLIPMNVNAASYKDYFTIDEYHNDNAFGRHLVVTLTNDKATNDEYGFINELKATFLMENLEGTYEPYTSENLSFYKVFPGAGASLKGVQVVASDGGSKKDAVEARFKVVIDVNFEDYKSKLTIDLDKMALDGNGTITNIDEIVTEDVVAAPPVQDETAKGEGFGSTPEDEPTGTTPDKVEITNKVENTGETTEPKADETVAIPENALDSNVFQTIKDNGNKVTYEAKENDKVKYAWTFDGSKMSKTDYNINLDLKVGSSTNEKTIKSLIPSNKEMPLVLEFGYHGELPDGTMMKINVADTYKDNEKLTLYYYNEESKKLEEIATDITVKDGYVEFLLPHCSEYVLAKDNATPNNAQTSGLNVILYGGLALVSLTGMIYLVKKSKKIA